jgi:hypothetical protein
MTAVADVIFIVVILALFGAAWLLVRACEAIIGAEEVTDITVEPRPADGEVAA